MMDEKKLAGEGAQRASERARKNEEQNGNRTHMRDTKLRAGSTATEVFCFFALEFLNLEFWDSK